MSASGARQTREPDPSSDPPGGCENLGAGSRQVWKFAGHGGAVMALEGQEPRKAPGPFPVKVRGIP
jgi:hypothetical protein